MSHYFSEKPISSGRKIILQTKYLGNVLTFKSQSGIFSWNEIDKGSEILLKFAKIPKQENACVLDCGCGYGLIGIALAKANPHLRIVLTDINELAIKLTKENCKLNSVQDITIVKRGHLFNPVCEMKFDLIITNPPISAGKKILSELISKSITFLTPSASFQLVAPKKKGLLSLEKLVKSVYSTYEILGTEAGFTVLMAKN